MRNYQTNKCMPLARQSTDEAVECAAAMARVRAVLSTAEQRLHHGQLRQAVGEVTVAIQELMTLHGTLLEAHVALVRREQARGGDPLIEHV